MVLEHGVAGDRIVPYRGQGGGVRRRGSGARLGSGGAPLALFDGDHVALRHSLWRRVPIRVRRVLQPTNHYWRYSFNLFSIQLIYYRWCSMSMVPSHRTKSQYLDDTTKVWNELVALSGRKVSLGLFRFIHTYIHNTTYSCYMLLYWHTSLVSTAFITLLSYMHVARFRVFLTWTLFNRYLDLVLS